MGYDLAQFAAECRRILKQDPGAEGRKKVARLVGQMCLDADFVRQYLTADAPERKILYEDPELGFCILGHVYHGAKQSNPHDHGPSWAIYGQAMGETVMTDWECLARPADGKPGKAKHVRDYAMKPGDAHVYNEGVLHSPRRDGPTRLIRIEGMNMDKVKRQAYERVAEAAPANAK
jgi:predicted metal-dependent enzyme (double-stranded beta helix superfamily)